MALTLNVSVFYSGGERESGNHQLNGKVLDLTRTHQYHEGQQAI